MMDPRHGYTVESGPNLYMSGKCDWHIRRIGEPGIIASFEANPRSVEIIRELLDEASRAVTLSIMLRRMARRATRLRQAGRELLRQQQTVRAAWLAQRK